MWERELALRRDATTDARVSEEEDDDQAFAQGSVGSARRDENTTSPTTRPSPNARRRRDPSQPPGTNAALAALAALAATRRRRRSSSIFTTTADRVTLAAAPAAQVWKASGMQMDGGKVVFRWASDDICGNAGETANSVAADARHPTVTPSC